MRAYSQIFEHCVTLLNIEERRVCATIEIKTRKFRTWLWSCWCVVRTTCCTTYL